MRVVGDSDGCREAARRLLHAAAASGRAGEGLSEDPSPDWIGLGAQRFSALATERVWTLRALAQRLTAAARAVDRFAEAIEELQSRARRLTAEAADAGLEMQEDGWIAPVLFDLYLDVDPDLLREAGRRRAVRRRLLAAAAELRAQAAEGHAQLGRDLVALDQREAAVEGSRRDVELSWLLPTRWDAPPLALAAGQAAAEVRRTLPSVLRSAGATTGLGFAYGVSTDLKQGRELDDAVTKNVGIVGAAGAAAGAVALAPIVIPGAAAIAAGAVAAYGTGKLFDKFGHHLPWVEQPVLKGAGRSARSGVDASRRPRRQPQPRPQSRPQPSAGPPSASAA